MRGKEKITHLPKMRREDSIYMTLKLLLNSSIFTVSASSFFVSVKMDTNNKEKTILNASVGEEARDKFPVGMRVLVVDDDSTCLMILEKMLKDCQYEVTTCGRARDALSMLRKDKNSFDIVLIDLHMPDMDGLKLLEIVGAEMDLPVVMMSSNDRKEVVMRGIVCGACHFLVKPVRMDAIKFLWQHVIRKKRNDLKEIGQQPVEDSVVQLKQPDDAAKMFARNKETTKSSKRKKDDEGEGEASEETSTERKRRFVWTAELHQKFSMAVNQLGHDKAVPKKILELMQEMNVTEITRENVASHLQKYRLHLQQEAERVDSKKSVFEQCSSLDGCNPQASATSSQPPLECFTSPPPGGLERQYANFSLGMRHVDQRNLFDTKIPESSSYPITIAKLSNLSFPLSRTSSGGIERLNANSSLGLPLADLTNHFDAKMTESSFYRVNELSRPALPLQRTNSGESVFAKIVSAGGLERLDANSSLGSPLIDQTNTLHGKMPGSSSYPVNEHAMVALPLWRTNSGDSFFGKTVSSGGFGRPESSAYPPTELSTFAAPLPLSRTSSGESFGNKSVSSLGNTSSGEEYIYRNLGNIAQQPRNLSIDDSYVLKDDNTSDLLYESLLHFKNLYHGDILRGPFT